jgi:hypothetical protein
MRTMKLVAILLLMAIYPGCGTSVRLYDAIEKGDVGAIKAIAKRDKSVLSKFPLSGDSPLIYAIDQGQKASYVALLENGADPNTIGPKGRNAMSFSARKQNSFWLEKALLHGGNPNLDNKATPTHRCTALISASEDTFLESVKLLVTHQADINYITVSEDALKRAADSNNFRVVLFLLQSGADYRRKVGRYSSFAGSIRQKTVSMFLQENDQRDFKAVIDWLHDHGVEWDKPHKDGDAWVY